jgi:putative sterol carrier protein
MPFFSDSEEVNKYLGGIFRIVHDTPTGPKLAAADIDLQIYYTEPDAKILIKMHGENIELLEESENEDADVKLYMPADTGDKYWRGEYNLAVGLAKGHVKAKGPVNKILKLVPLTRPIFPMYREMVADKDAAVV